ncbi:hypothetical protein HY631_00940 [Candidatus Uhrbacteria bacterium]|nr:hypothetical protein [Candidatus Uhrbacteria bacterium]
MTTVHPWAMRLLFLAVAMSFLFGAPLATRAAETACDCYCAVDGTGAKRQGMLTAEACQSKCETNGSRVAACASSSAELPSEHVMCFKESECTAQGGKLDTKYQPGECMQGERYCYPDSSKAAKVTLQVSIGSLKVPADLGEYIAAVYNWLIGAATLIAIVFIMVGGLQWSFGAASAELMGKAKKRMTNGVIGLVLLLSTYFILATVNPNLLKLKVPDFPMIKTVALVEGQTSCGYLTGTWGTSAYLTQNGAPEDSPHAQGQPAPKGGKPYTVEKPSKGTECGSVATITKDWEGNSVAEQTCTYDYCSGKGERCFVSASGGQCTTCESLVIGNPYFTPSSSLCPQFSRLTTYSGGAPQTRNGYIVNEISQQCFWTGSPFLLTAASLDLDTWKQGACAMLTMDCSAIDTCEDYDTTPQASNLSATVPLEQVIGGMVDGTYNLGDESLDSICSADPCNVAQKEGMEGKKCSAHVPTITGDSLISYITGAPASLLSIIQGNDCKSISVNAEDEAYDRGRTR